METNGNRLTPSGEFTTYGMGAPVPYVYLTDENGTYATEVSLGCYDSPSNWRDATQGEKDEYMNMSNNPTAENEP